MYRIILIVALLLPQVTLAEVFMCTDPATGQKSFTDKACPKLTKGKKVKVVPTNFGDGIHRTRRQQTWNSEVDNSVSGTDNLRNHSVSIAQAENTGR